MHFSNQHQASDPAYSVWLNASAGTGKTKVLIDRLLRLLLKGAIPHKILCLTFTNAAANEIQTRIYSKLSHWSGCTAQELTEELENLLQRPPLKAEKTRARELLQIYLTQEEHISIHTIHSFCQKILQRFPMEAGVMPHFKIMDAVYKDNCITHIKEIVLQKISARIGSIISKMHDTAFKELIDYVLSNQLKFRSFFEHYQDCASYEQYLKSALQIKHLALEKVEAPIKSFILSKVELHFLHNICSQEDFIFSLRKLFLTAKHEKLKRLPFKEHHTKSAAELLQLQEMVYAACNQEKSIELYQASSELYLLARCVLDEYQKYKDKQSYLDYDDLLYHIKNLFSKSEFKDWILYKLEGGIDHILVDEAQDTSLYQWYLIAGLIEDFISRTEAEDKTLFVVGDDKQSIYSFQGAVHEYFAHIRTQILDSLKLVQKPYRVLNLDTSYRSSQVILDVVDQVFKNIRLIDTALFSSDNFGLKCHRTSYGGSFELWDKTLKQDKQNFFWPIFQENSGLDPKKALAQKIAKYIKELVASKKVLSCTQKPVRFGDIMILLRQRSDFAQELVSALNELGLPSSGLDKVSISEDLCIQDLLAAAKFALSPEDDLNLAALLKSPLIGMQESQLLSIANARKSSLYLHLCESQEHKSVVDKLSYFQQLASTLSPTNFFHVLIYSEDNLSKLKEAIGSSAIESAGYLVSLASQFEQEFSNSLYEFVSWCSSGEIEISRDHASSDSICIMTVHGSKGLQAPIIILPDTTTVPTQQDNCLWDSNNCPIFAINSSQYDPYYKNLRQNASQIAYKEYIRLLYVALTRAEEHIVFCGYDAGSSTKSWYEIVAEAVKTMPGVIKEEDKHVYANQISSDAPGYMAEQTEITMRAPIFPDKKHPITLPRLREVPLSPFDIHSGATQLGKFVHKILEEVVATKDLSLLSKHSLLSFLSTEERSLFSARLAALADNAEFCELLEHETKTEVTLGSKEKTLRIDLLSVQKDKVVIVDYKTDKVVPNSISEVPSKYLHQVKEYQDWIRNIYPGKLVQAKILWLSKPVFMDIHE